MNGSSCSALPQTLRKRTSSDCAVLSAQDKIQNILLIHDCEEKNRSFNVDLVTNSITINQSNKKVRKTFLFDTVLLSDDGCEAALVSAIKGVVDKRDALILSTNQELGNKSELVNQKILTTLVTWMMEYLIVCSAGGGVKYSVRLSGLEINEEADTITEIGSPHGENEPITVENQYCHRCGDTDSALDIINQFHFYSKQSDLIRKQNLYTIHLYQHVSHCSIASSVSSQCSRIFLLLMDLSGQENNAYFLSPGEFVKFLLTCINRNCQSIDIQSNFQKLIYDVIRKYSNNLCLITQISANEKHSIDTYQLLQMTSRIQRLKVKSKICWDNAGSSRPNRPAMGTGAYRRSEKYSDTEVASTSGMSCAETVIFTGKERGQQSDDESRRLRSIFISSDSDSGYRDLKVGNFGESRGTTPTNNYKKQSRPRTNALVWPKSALIKAKTALMNGEELWVDGPNAEKKFESTHAPTGTTSITGTIKQMMLPNCPNKTPIMISQETQCDDDTSCSGKRMTEDNRPLSDISEKTEDSDTIQNMKQYSQRSNQRLQSSNPLQHHPIDGFLSMERDEVRHLSNWIHNVDDFTISNDEFLTKPPQRVIPITSDEVNRHCYQYYDPGSQGEYNSFPRVYNQIQYNPYNPVMVRGFDVAVGRSSPFTEQKANISNAKQTVYDLNSKEKNLKSKKFSALELLKKTLMRGKKKIKKCRNETESITNVPGCPEFMYMIPIVISSDDSTDSSSDSDCNEWFRKTFKSKEEFSQNKQYSVRPPSAPLLAGSNSALRPQYSSRQRSSSSGYGSVVTRDSEISSHQTSPSDQSIDDLACGVIAQKCEYLVKQEKAFLLIQEQQIMVHDFYSSTRPLLTNEDSKYTLRVSNFDINRVTTDNQYLEELEEDTNVIRDTISFYKSLVHLESSFVTSPGQNKRNIL